MRKKIRSLLKEKDAVLLAHNYQPPEIQDVADLCGDSLDLSFRASQTQAKIIVFCGVHFMAETAALLSPDKCVLLPRHDAGCAMADMVTPEALKAELRRYPSMPVVAYVNSPVSVKAMSTICCTSANAVRVVQSLDADEIMMVPDRNLSCYTASLTNKRIHAWNGCCPFHDLLTAEDVRRARDDHPDAVFMAHPECRMEVIKLADAVLSTSGMIRYAVESNHKAFIVGTEEGLLHPLKKANPRAEFYPASPRMVCRDMKKISLQDILRSLESLEGRVVVPEAFREPALLSVRRMMALSRQPGAARPVSPQRH